MSWAKADFAVDSIDSTISDQNERANALYDELHDEDERQA